MIPPLLVLVLVIPSLGATIEPTERLSRMVFVLMTQEHNEELSARTESALKESLMNAGLHEAEMNIVATGRETPLHGAWTFFPLFPILQEEFKGDFDWFIFLQENARVNPSALLSVLEPHAPDDSLFMGYALRDRDHTVIHHYDPPGLPYPAFGSGFVLSFKLVEGLANRMARFGLNVGKFPSTFSIDPLYELASVIHYSHMDNLAEDPQGTPPPEGPLLIHSPAFCLNGSSEASCATYALPNPSCPLGSVLNRTLFAVKTTESFHVSRLGIILKTWGRAAPNIIYASEAEDPSIPTLALPGIANTLKGHCQKTSSIIRYFNLNTTYDWLVIADDDTLLSVRKIGEVLACYEPSGRAISLGQRYGFRVATGEYGYDYITGGGGMIFSRSATEKMFSHPEYCSCPKADYPDDMHLGSCMSNIGSPVVHHSGFHQARPEDYDERLLLAESPVSFHKFINTDPLKIYEKWFAEADRDLLPTLPEPGTPVPHEEL